MVGGAKEDELALLPVCKHNNVYPCEFCLEERIADLEAENARLQVDIERERRRCKNTALAWAHAGEMQDEVARLQARETELVAKLIKANRYKALEERRGEALEPFVHSARTIDMADDVGDGYVVALIPVTLGDVRRARAALAATPEALKRDKEIGGEPIT